MTWYQSRDLPVVHLPYPQNVVKIKTRDGGRLHLQAPSKLTGDYDPDFESTVDEGVAGGVSVSRRGGWLVVSVSLIRVSSSVARGEGAVVLHRSCPSW